MPPTLIKTPINATLPSDTSANKYIIEVFLVNFKISFIAQMIYNLEKEGDYI